MRRFRAKMGTVHHYSMFEPVFASVSKRPVKNARKGLLLRHLNGIMTSVCHLTHHSPFSGSFSTSSRTVPRSRTPAAVILDAVPRCAPMRVHEPGEACVEAEWTLCPDSINVVPS